MATSRHVNASSTYQVHELWRGEAISEILREMLRGAQVPSDVFPVEMRPRIVSKTLHVAVRGQAHASVSLNQGMGWGWGLRAVSR